MLGEASNPSLIATTPLDPAPFVQPPKPLTRQQDKRAAATGIVEPDPVDSSTADTNEVGTPALGLSKAFDSFDATMRLAALTGMEKELDQFTETQKIARLKALSQARRGVRPNLSDSTTWRQTASMPGARAGSNSSSGAAGLRYVWIGSAVLAAGAVLLLLLR
jgi:hypothetical protein